ncbi:hypothetical protein HAX54_034557, partial [Datura stramonium]|nr:hypothetical protein [Datura stramonium]
MNTGVIISETISKKSIIERKTLQIRQWVKVNGDFHDPRTGLKVARTNISWNKGLVDVLSWRFRRPGMVGEEGGKGSWVGGAMVVHREENGESEREMRVAA